MKRPRIAVVSLFYGESGGAELFASEVADRLAEAGEFEIHVLAHRWKDRTGRIAFHRIDFRRWPRSIQKLSVCLAVRKVAAAERFDLIHSHELLDVADVVTFGAPVALWPKIQKKNGAHLPTLVNRRIERRLLFSDRLRWVLANSKESIGWLLDEYPGLAKRPVEIRTLYPGVDVRRFAPPGPEERAAGRAELAGRFGWKRTDPIGLFVGNNWSHKGLRTTFQALSLLRQRGYPARLLVMGSDRKKEWWFQEMIDLGLKVDDVAFLGEIGDGRELYFQSADFLIFLSRFESFGTVVLEAAASGLPVILSGRVPAREILPEEGRQLIEDPMDCLGASRAMEQWIRNPVAREKCASQAARAARAYSWEAAADATAAVYRRCLSRKAQ
ncbi:UDP-glucose:(heptosyl)LPS alpha-1,3-glucosyltransferase [Methylacidimicrobium cyclopophantes]|uniref:UDP-glucose:(Heptosyl)LPS alpha-1,3-glucosyltransferase n=1 Tax=Methylacidimicrobium cyclopophantes TaxID=1041766 RepID=A0A5E6MF02_9BACT|nr:glycosyltransferase family 4 protein [Methylacidimicrobium cyclopophantes]VVM06946.1 UDP-glucose:(heptosyl)LPS alpha-1,3-glucosyltransferase [Methylacidimicrobium cyclopophantes]